MKHTDNHVTFAEVWACLRQPGSQWVSKLLARKLRNDAPGMTVDSSVYP